MKFNSNFLNVIFFASQGTWQPEEHPKGSLNLIDQVEKEKEKRRKRIELKTKKTKKISCSPNFDKPKGKKVQQKRRIWRSTRWRRSWSSG